MLDKSVLTLELNKLFSNAIETLRFLRKITLNFSRFFESLKQKKNLSRTKKIQITDEGLRERKGDKIKRSRSEKISRIARTHIHSQTRRTSPAVPVVPVLTLGKTNNRR